MSSHTIDLTDRIREYLLNCGIRESDAARDLRISTQSSRMPAAMQISPEQGAFMAWLVRLLGARRAIEIGTFTGYSALVVAEALPPDGKLITCDISEEWTRFGRPYWDRAGVSERIDLRLGPASETLNQLILQGESDAFDFAFIDADKANYPVYYQQLMELIRPNGIIGIDNVLWGGAVADPENQQTSTTAIRLVNSTVLNDSRVWSTMLPIGDGLTLAMKKP